jgi:hypothetical protein
MTVVETTIHRVGLGVCSPSSCRTSTWPSYPARVRAPTTCLARSEGVRRRSTSEPTSDSVKESQRISTAYVSPECLPRGERSTLSALDNLSDRSLNSAVASSRCTLPDTTESCRVLESATRRRERAVSSGPGLPLQNRSTDCSGPRRCSSLNTEGPITRGFPSSGRWDSNPRHLAWEASALPTELRPRSLHPSRVKRFSPPARATHMPQTVSHWRSVDRFADTCESPCP